MLSSCIFAVWRRSGVPSSEVVARLDDLARFYGPLGAGPPSCRMIAGGGVTVGSIRFGPPPQRSDSAALAWGGALPHDLTSSARLLAAGDTELRSLSGSVAAIAADEERALIVTGAAPPTTLYVARSSEIAAWSSHAVAAAYLAHRDPRIDRSAIPELLATDFVAGGRCLIEAAEPVPPATATEITSGGYRSRSYWPARERWKLVDEDEADQVAAEALARTLPRRLAGFDTIALGLTGGLDSRVAAVALRDAGIPFRCFTWGTEGPDVDGAKEVARLLELEHEALPPELWADQEALARTQESARWHEGAIHLGFGRPRTPPGIDVQLMGGGGEVGRAFFYRDASGLFRTPSPAQCVRFLERQVAPRLAGATSPAHDALGRSLKRWIAAAQESGLAGWRLLDVVLVEQRMQHWLRAMLPLQRAPVVHAFASPDLMRALCSLPLRERLTDGFHRRFLRTRDPRLVPPPARPGPGYQPALAIARRLRYQPALAIARRLRWRALPGRRRSLLRAGGFSPSSPSWGERPQFRAWIANDVLGSHLLADVMGERWAGEVRRGFLAGEAEAERLAVLAAGPVALDSALLSLGRSS